ncbi:MAG: twin-arginine translocation signal domain-containing protein [Betaproteobacteria bacterium]
MERRDFLRGCALAGGSVALVKASRSAPNGQPVKAYPPARLVDRFGDPIKAAQLVPNRNYLFNYPYTGTPCFLLRLDHAAAAAELVGQDGRPYGWDGGVGPGRAIVAYSAICAHKLAYPAREISFIRFQEQASATSRAGVIHCCAEHSIYDPAAGAKVVGGPAPQPLAAIVLAHDPRSDALTATGSVGPEQFDAFFAKYEFKLGMQFGPGRAQQLVGNATICQEMTQVCRQTVQC